MTADLTPLSPDERDALKALCEQATPGPWHVGIRVQDAVFVESPSSGFTHIVSCLPESHGAPDAEFIAAARSALPRLLAETERLREMLLRSYRHIAPLIDGVPVQYVGVYVTRWGRADEPTDGFVEICEDDIDAARQAADARTAG